MPSDAAPMPKRPARNERGRARRRCARKATSAPPAWRARAPAAARPGRSTLSALSSRSGPTYSACRWVPSSAPPAQARHALGGRVVAHDLGRQQVRRLDAEVAEQRVAAARRCPRGSPRNAAGRRTRQPGPLSRSQSMVTHRIGGARGVARHGAGAVAIGAAPPGSGARCARACWRPSKSRSTRARAAAPCWRRRSGSRKQRSIAAARPGTSGGVPRTSVPSTPSSSISPMPPTSNATIGLPSAIPSITARGSGIGVDAGNHHDVGVGRGRGARRNESPGSGPDRAMPSRCGQRDARGAVILGEIGRRIADDRKAAALPLFHAQLVQHQSCRAHHLFVALAAQDPPRAGEDHGVGAPAQLFAAGAAPPRPA